MSLKLYKANLSPPSRAVMMICELYNVPVEMIEVDLFSKEQMTSEFLKLNPMHTVPVLLDGDLVIQDSHAAVIYLIEKYDKDDALYPKDIKKRTLVNQKLFFNSSSYFNTLLNLVKHIHKYGEKSINNEQLETIQEVYNFLETFLSTTKYVAGDTLTIADIVIYATASTYDFMIPIDEQKYPKTRLWMKYMEQQPYSQKQNAAGAKLLGEAFKL